LVGGSPGAGNDLGGSTVGLDLVGISDGYGAAAIGGGCCSCDVGACVGRTFQDDVGGTNQSGFDGVPDGDGLNAGRGVGAGIGSCPGTGDDFGARTIVGDQVRVGDSERAAPIGSGGHSGGVGGRHCRAFEIEIGRASDGWLGGVDDGDRLDTTGGIATLV